MDEKDIAEQAYKNGYKAGVKEFAERVLTRYGVLYPDDDLYAFEVLNDVRNIRKELLEKRNVETPKP